MAVPYDIPATARPVLSPDQRAHLAELIRRHYRQVVNVAYRVVRDSDQAADIAQTVFLKMALNFWRYDTERKFSTWLHRITLNAAIDQLRRSRRTSHESLDSCEEMFIDSGPTPDRLYYRRRLAKHVVAATKLLSSKERSAFHMRDVEGHEINHIAATMRVPEATVRWYVHRARARLRKELTISCPQLLADRTDD